LEIVDPESLQAFNEVKLMKAMALNRDVTIDTIRGLAIFTMVAANLAPDVLIEPHPFWFRFYGSFAAPFFILISGMMVAFTTQTKGHGLNYFLLRGTMIATTGVFVDLAYKIYPFTSVDILYLIGISLPLAYLLLRMNKLCRWVITIVVFVITPILQKIFGYTDYPTEIYLWGEKTIIAKNQTSVLNHWIVDGWFPIFPWIGFSLLGVNLANLRKSLSTFGKGSVFLIGACIFALGSIFWWQYPGSLLTRGGSSELFYPATIGYIMSAVGLIRIVFFVVDQKPSLIIYRPLQVLGRSSLLIYLLHLELIEYIITPIWTKANLQTFLLIYICLLWFLILVAYGLMALKTKLRDRPFVIRFLFGG